MGREGQPAGLYGEKELLTVVAYMRRVALATLLSKRMLYPIRERFVPREPGASPSSCETRWASEIAEIRLGSVQNIFAWRPFASACSRIIVGVWVDLPLRKTDFSLQPAAKV